MSKIFKTAIAFRKSLESRLMNISQETDIDLGDYFTFTFRPAMQELDGAPEGGFRFPVEAIMDGRPFVKFHIDIGIGDILVEPVEKIIGEDWLEFAGISPAIIYAISKEQQFAEKLHAYTLPHIDRLNTRVKDLVDMLLLIREGSVDETVVRDNLSKVFHRRNTHSLPATLPLPPNGWDVKFDLLAKECGMNEPLDQAMEIVNYFYRKAIASHSLNDVLLS